jgi:hypothetical protein
MRYGRLQDDSIVDYALKVIKVGISGNETFFDVR